MSFAEEFEFWYTCHFRIEYEENAEKCVPVAECCWNVCKINFALIFVCCGRQFASVNEFFFAEILKFGLLLAHCGQPNAK